MSGYSEKAVYWVKLLSKFVSVELIIQALGFASGILIIRILNKEEYAYFTIANSLQSTMNVLSESGIGSGILLIGGKVWQKPYLFSQLIRTGMQLKYYLGVITVILVLPILLWLLISNGTSFVYTILIILAILIEFYFYLIQGLLVNVPILKSQIKQIQILNIIYASSRLLFLGVAWLTSFNALTCLCCSTAASIFKTVLLQRWNKGFLEKNISINKDYSQQIKESIRNVIAYSIFFCIQGQITIWLISVFGQTKSIAEVGALGRLGVIFTVMSSVVSNIVVPRFAKCQSLKLLRLRYFQIMLIYASLSITLLVFSVTFPQELLWILGNKYSHLQKELFLMVFTAMIYSISSVAWSLNNSRGWIKDSWLIIPSTILVQILLLIILDVSNVKGVIIFGLISALPTLLVNFYLNYKGFSEHYAF